MRWNPQRNLVEDSFSSGAVNVSLLLRISETSACPGVGHSARSAGGRICKSSIHHGIACTMVFVLGHLISNKALSPVDIDRDHSPSHFTRR